MQKILSLLFAMLVMASLASCGSDEPSSNRTVTTDVATLNHVLDGNDNSAQLASSQTQFAINRGTMKAQVSNKFAIGGTAYDIELSNISVEQNSATGIFTLSAKSATSGNNTVTDLTGTYNYFIDAVTLSYTLNGRYRVNAIERRISFQYTETESKCDTATLKYPNTVFAFSISPDRGTADLDINALRLNKSLGQISELSYEGLTVTANPNGFEVTAQNKPTVTKITNPLNYLIGQGKWQISVGTSLGASMSGSLSIPSYAITTKGTLYKDNSEKN